LSNVFEGNVPNVSATYIEASKAVSPVGFTAPHAHNGYIDLILDIGLIGAILFGISFITTWVRSLKLAYWAQAPEQLWPLGFLLFLTINNMTESYLLWNTNVYWVIYIALALSIKKRSWLK
jgi:O-antigen ligase